MGAGGDVLGRGAAEREVKKHQLQPAAAAFGNANVLGLDVAVRHAFGFEVVHGLDQFLAEALEHVERQAPFFAKLFRQGPGARALEQ